MILRIGDFYLGYNKATGFNEGTRDARNKVTVHYKRGSVNTVAFKKLDSKLWAGKPTYLQVSESVRVGVKYSQNINYKDAVVELFLSEGDAAEYCPSQSTAPALNCDDIDFQIEFKSNSFGAETSIAMFSLNLVYITRMIFKTTRYDLPQEKDRCYLLVIRDSFGDGLTFGDVMIEKK